MYYLLILPAHCFRSSVQIPFEYSATSIDGITFDNDPRLYAPVRELCLLLSREVIFDNGTVYIDSSQVECSARLVDGSLLLPVRSLNSIGYEVTWDSSRQVAHLRKGEESWQVLRRPKSILIDKVKQELSAYQGKRLVLITNISTGRPGHETPGGTFRVGLIKHKMHYSSLYGQAPMPWAIQVNHNIFIHGYSEVPPFPASHGCIRVPLTEGNPARWLFDWVEDGTAVTIR